MKYTVFGIEEDGRIYRDVIEAPDAEAACFLAPPRSKFHPFKVIAVFEYDVDDELKLKQATDPRRIVGADRWEIA